MSKYVRAARNVLVRHGKPLHYEMIAELAIEWGYLDTSAQNPDIVMSTTLSSDISNNPASVFNRVRPGVYEVNQRAEFTQTSVVDSGFSDRVEWLASHLELRSALDVVKQGLFLIRRARRVMDNDCAITICSDNCEWLTLRLHSPKEAVKDLVRWVEEYRGEWGVSEKGSKVDFRLSSEVFHAARELGNKLSIQDPTLVIELGVALLDAVTTLNEVGYVVVEGPRGSIRVME